jgi:hypothetical protein
MRLSRLANQSRLAADASPRAFPRRWSWRDGSAHHPKKTHDEVIPEPTIPTGNPSTDRVHARASARAGADIVAVLPVPLDDASDAVSRIGGEVLALLEAGPGPSEVS